MTCPLVDEERGERKEMIAVSLREFTILPSLFLWCVSFHSSIMNFWIHRLIIDGMRLGES